VLSIYFMIKYTFFLLLPFLIAILFSAALNPIVTMMEIKMKLPRSLATGLTIIITFAITSGIGILLFSEIIQGTTYLAEHLPAHLQTFVSFFERFLKDNILPLYHKFTSFFHSLSSSQQITLNENIQQFINQISSSGALILKNLLLKIPVFLSMLPNSITIFIFIILSTFLITNDWYTLKYSIEKVIPNAMSESGKNMVIHLKKALFGFIKAQFLLVSITCGSIYIGFLMIQVDHALTIALIAAVVDLLPYIGTGIIFIPWIIFLFFSENYSLTINLTFLYMFVTILRQIIEPKLLSMNVGLHPLATLISLFICIQLWGFIGLILAPLLLVVLHVIYQTGIAKQVWQFIKG